MGLLVDPNTAISKMQRSIKDRALIQGLKLDLQALKKSMDYPYSDQIMLI
jgi:hypothetical protein